MARPVYYFFRQTYDLTPEAFLAKYPDSVLVIEADRNATGDTTHHTGNAIDDPAMDGGEPLVVTVRRMAHSNSTEGCVSVGQGSRNDVCVWGKGVADVHALIDLNQSPPVLFAMSSEPTTLAGRVVTKGAGALLSCGTKLVFGSLRLTFYTSEGFWRHLKAMGPERPTPRVMPAVRPPPGFQLD